MKLPRGLVKLKINLPAYFYIAEWSGLKFLLVASTNLRMGYHVLNSLEIWDRTTDVNIWFFMKGKMHVHCVCGGSESEYTSGRKDFILGPRLEGRQQVFSSFPRREQRIFKTAYWEQMFFNICFQFQEPPPPLVVVNDTFLGTNNSRAKCSNSIHQ